jgi:hypothetical protein
MSLLTPEGLEPEYGEVKGNKQVKSKTVCGINYTAAFVLLATGKASMREIASAWNVPIHKIAKRSTAESWTGLMRRFCGERGFKEAESTPDPLEMLEKKKKVQANRDKILAASGGLIERIQVILDQSPVMDAETIAMLSRGIKMLGEISMLASGDEYVLKSPGIGSAKAGLLGNGSGNKGALISITFPTMLSKPRVTKRVNASLNEAEGVIAKAETDLLLEQGEDDSDEQPAAGTG